MIRNRKELKFYLYADKVMNEQVFPQSFIKRLFLPCLIQKFLRTMRYAEYLKYKKEQNIFFIPFYGYYAYRYHKLKEKTGFDIPLNTLGYGVRIGHLSTIIINGATKIGNYCSLANNIVIADGNPKNIGNHVQLSSNIVIAKRITIADGCRISSCSFLNSNALTTNTLWGGVKAKPIKECSPWTTEEPYHSEWLKCEEMRIKLGIK